MALTETSRLSILSSSVTKQGRKRGEAYSAQQVLMHCYSGTITDIPEGTETHFKVGDRVAIECGHMCGTCRFCKTGRYNLCKVSTSKTWLVPAIFNSFPL